jgi:hypothetical protein
VLLSVQSFALSVTSTDVTRVGRQTPVDSLNSVGLVLKCMPGI